jgi:hypothetical protein
VCLCARARVCVRVCVCVCVRVSVCVWCLRQLALAKSELARLRSVHDVAMVRPPPRPPGPVLRELSQVVQLPYSNMNWRLLKSRDPSALSDCISDPDCTHRLIQSNATQKGAPETVSQI